MMGICSLLQVPINRILAMMLLIISLIFQGFFQFICLSMRLFLGNCLETEFMMLGFWQRLGWEPLDDLVVVLLYLLGFIGVYYPPYYQVYPINLLIYHMGNKPNFQAIRKDTIEHRDIRLNKFTSVFQQIINKSKLNKEDIDQITRKDVPELVNMLNLRKITSQTLLAIYGLRAIRIGRQNCIITEDNFEYALKKAQECDDIRMKQGKTNWTINDEWDTTKFLPPLFGVPMSIKQNIPIKGLRSTVGLSVRANRIDEQDCGIITCLKNSGAIPFIKTNLPQLALCYDSFNFLWGRTLNPWNKNKSAGGSSGGEGASIAARVSPLGVGNDMLGSIRIPASFNGVFALMPSPHRMPSMGEFTCSKYSTGFSGMDTIAVVNGPLGNSVDGLALFMKVATNEQSYGDKLDPYTKLNPFDHKKYKKYNIGYFDSFKLIQTTTSSRRGVRQTVQFLKKDGHNLIPITIPNLDDLLMVPFKELVGQGQMLSFQDMLEGEQIIKEYKLMYFITNRNWCLFNCIKSLVKKLYPRIGQGIQASSKLSLHQYLQHSGRVKECRAQWIKYWKSNKLDFVVCPSFASQAANHGSSSDGSFLAAYTYIWNALQMTCCIQPVTVVGNDQLTYESQWDDDMTTLIRNNLKDAAGMPICVQIVGLPFQQQKVLGLSKKVQGHFKFYKNHPLPNMNK